MLLCVYYPSSHWGRHTHLINWLQPLKLSHYLCESITLVLAHHPSASAHNVPLSGMIRHDCPHLDVESVKEKMEICFFPSAACLPFKCHCEHLNVFKIIYCIWKVPRAHACADVTHTLSGIFAAASVELFQAELPCRCSCQSPEWECSREASHIFSPSRDKILKRTQSLFPMLPSDL